MSTRGSEKGFVPCGCPFQQGIIHQTPYLKYRCTLVCTALLLYTTVSSSIRVAVNHVLEARRNSTEPESSIELKGTTKRTSLAVAGQQACSGLFITNEGAACHCACLAGHLLGSIPTPDASRRSLHIVKLVHLHDLFTTPRIKKSTQMAWLWSPSRYLP